MSALELGACFDTCLIVDDRPRIWHGGVVHLGIGMVACTHTWGRLLMSSTMANGTWLLSSLV